MTSPTNAIITVDAGRDQVLVEERGPDVHVQRLGSGVVKVAADDYPYFLDTGAAQKSR